jgi:phage/plasmid-like protein (TIGR03299 family)
MSDMIENNNMFSVSLVPWHKKGVVLDAPPTSAEAIQAAGMDWDVEKRQLYYHAEHPTIEHPEGENFFNPAEGRFGLFRATDSKLFGVVSQDYEVVQNRDSFSFFDPMIQEGIATYETAGVLTDGRVWILARVAGDMVVANDEIRKYIMMLNDHSGSGSVILQPTPIRAVCNNTIMQSLAQGMVFKHAHRKGVQAKMNVTKNEIPITDELLDSYLNSVLDVDLSTTDGDQTEKVDRATSNKLKAVSVIKDMYESGLGATGDTRGTVYGAYNAVVEFADWRMGARSKDRARYQLFGAGAELKKKAYDEALTFA